MVAFNRDIETGTLTFAGMVQDGVGDVDGLSGVLSVVVSPDGKHVYTASLFDSAVSLFTRNKVTGVLTFKETYQDGMGGLDSLGQAASVAVSGDGRSVYVASIADDSVSVFDRDLVTGELTFVEVQQDEFGGVDGLDGAISVTVSPNDKNVYVVGLNDDAVAVFNRESVTGALSFVEVHKDGVSGTSGLDGAREVAISSDGQHLYVSSSNDDALVAFLRDPITGGLTLLKTYQDGLDGVEGLDGAASVVITLDGRQLYVAGQDDEAVAVFDRDSATGDLSFVEARRREPSIEGGLIQPTSLMISPDDQHVYVANSGLDNSGIAVFRRAASKSPFVEGGGPVAVTDVGSNLKAIDDDNDQLLSATVTIVNLLDSGQEILAATVFGTNITARYDGAMLTLTGPDTVARFEQVLRTITYDNTSDDPHTADRQISLTLNDGESNSQPVFVFVAVTADTPPAEIRIQMSVNDADASEAPGPVVRTGSTATIRYDVRNTGDTPLTDVQVTDDRATPGDISDDVSPILIDGDGNQNSLLDPDETWQYEIDVPVTVEGMFVHIVDVVAAPIDDAENPVTDSGSAHYEARPPNQAPELVNADDIPLTDVSEDNTDPTGTLVATIIAGRITDVAGDDKGVAIVGIDDINGQWQYDAGLDWVPFGAISDAGAVLLDATSKIRFVPTADYAGSAGRVTFRGWDQTFGASGDTGIDVSTNGGETAFSSDVGTAKLNVTAINDPPENSIPNDQEIDEDTTLVFSAANNNLISIQDKDASDDLVQVTLTATDGVVSLASIDTLDFSVGNGADDTVMTFAGLIADINVAMDGMSFIPDADFVGGATLQILTDDQGNTGSGLAEIDEDTIQITTKGVNDAPVITVPETQMTNEQTTLVFSTANMNPISIADVDAEGATLEVTLTASKGDVTLAATEGLTFTSGDGSADSVMTFTGTIARINLALEGLSFEPTSDTGEAATLQILTDDQGNTGAGDPLSDTDLVTVTVEAINDAPVNTVPSEQETNEDAGLVFSSSHGNAVTVSDPDEDASAVEVTLTVTNGVVTLRSIEGLVFTSGDGTANDVMTFAGGVNEINMALDGLTFDPTPHFEGVANIQIETEDQGDGGNVGPLSDSDSVTIAVMAVNDAPVNMVPGDQVTDEDTTLVFLSGNGNAISVSDRDAIAESVHVTLSAVSGRITLASTDGLSITTGTGSEDTTVTVTGTLEDINTALDGLSFHPIPEFSGVGSLQIFTHDLGSSGFGGAKSDSDSIQVVIGIVNDSPVNLVPSPQTTNEGLPLLFSAVNGNLIAVDDIDVGDNAIRVTLISTNGTMTLSTAGGLEFLNGDGTSDTQMAFTGTIVAINAALDGLIFLPSPGFLGGASVQIETNDLSFSGAGDQQVDTDTVTIAVENVNDPPVNHVPVQAPSTLPDTSLIFSTANGGTLSIIDPDAGVNPIEATITVTDGVMTLSNLSDVTFTVGDGSADAVMTFRGSISNINAALEGAIFDPDPGFSGVASVEITSDDLGESGAGDSLTDTDAFNILVDNLNDAPLITVPPDQVMNEDAEMGFVFSAANGNRISISDGDAGSDELKVTLRSGINGAMTLATTASLFFTAGDGSADSSMIFTGSIESINSALDGVKVVPTEHFHGTVNLRINIDDLGHNGSGGGQRDVELVRISVESINDAPVNTHPPGDLVTDENLEVVFSSINGNAISISDVDEANSGVQMTLNATSGLLSLADVNGVTLIGGTGLDDPTVTMVGSTNAINAVLDGLRFLPTPDFVGVATIELITDDLGGSGAGGARAAIDILNITVEAVNRAPENRVPTEVAIDEDTMIVLSDDKRVSVVDEDAGESSVEVVLKATNGVITLAGSEGLTFLVGTGTDDAEIVLSGAIEDINAGLDGLQFTPAPEFSGTASIEITTDDLGNTGNGSPLSDVDAFDITVHGVNDPPQILAPSDQATDEDTSIFFSAGHENLISVGDPDADNESVIVTLTATNGVLTLSRLTGLTFSEGTGAIDLVMVMAGAISSINTALDGMRFDPLPDFSGQASIQIDVNDHGHTGLGGELTESKMVAVTVQSRSDAPLVATPISDVFVNINAPITTRDLSGLFNDTDILTDGDNLTLAVIGNTNSALVTTNLDGENLTLVYTSDQSGQAEITLQATDQDGQMVTDTFMVTVSSLAARAVWINHSDLISILGPAEDPDDPNLTELVDAELAHVVAFLTGKRVTDVYLFAGSDPSDASDPDLLLQDRVAEVALLITALKKEGIRVYATLHDVGALDIQVTRAQFSQALAYNGAQSDPAAQFDGVILKLQPWISDGPGEPVWGGQMGPRSIEYLDLIDELNRQAPEDLLVAAVIPAELMDHHVTWTSTLVDPIQLVVEKPMHQHVQDIADFVVVSALSDRAVKATRDGIIDVVEDEVFYASRVVQRPVVIGIETKDLGLAQADATFFQEGEVRLERALGEVQDLWGTPQSAEFVEQFGGFAIQDLSGYRSMAPQVVAVELHGSSWSETFLNHLAKEGLGVHGFAIPTGSDQQLIPLAWVGLDQLTIQFNEDVDVQLNDLVIRDGTATELGFVNFVYDKRTFLATWTLASSLGAGNFAITLADRRDRSSRPSS